MVRKTTRQRIDPGEASKYAAVAAQFCDAAELARDCRYWNAAGFLLVHGSIAWADAMARGTRARREEFPFPRRGCAIVAIQGLLTAAGAGARRVSEGGNPWGR